MKAGLTGKLVSAFGSNPYYYPPGTIITIDWVGKDMIGISTPDFRQWELYRNYWEANIEFIDKKIERIDPEIRWKEFF
jgi:hypothetical protein